LAKGIEVALAAGEQIILFINRRGEATFVMCRDCGHVLKCPRCDLPLTYHSAVDDLICHHCNYKTFVPPQCPSCWSGRIRYFGTGTQRVEELVRQAYPRARVVRWDLDTTGGKLDHERLLDQFIKGEEDIIGTKSRPLEIAVPVADKTTPLADYVKQHTGLVCREVAAGSLGELLDLLDEDKVDVVIVPAAVYALASEPYALLAILRAERDGTFDTRGMILVRADRGLVAVEDAKGLTVAAVDPTSLSGCLLQRVLVTELGAVPSKVTYLDNEAAVVRAVYDGTADLGFVTWRLNDEGNPADARETLFGEVPDVFQAVVPLAVTQAVAYDAVAVCARVPDAVRARLSAALLEYAETSRGRAYLAERYGIEGLAPSDDVEYADLRTRLKAAKVRLGELLREEDEERE
jgi:ABC-type phosphate/phosphonate transport system substrate-binding protein